MALKTNYEKNGAAYFRLTATIGRDVNGKLIRKEFSNQYSSRDIIISYIAVVKAVDVSKP